jgi:8-oxo-dGTP pyrophosphatase MutT (NUDIX family)
MPIPKIDLFPDWAKMFGMRLSKEEKQELENEERMEKTGFWGKAAAGCLPVAVDTKRFLFALRSEFVEEPKTWGLWGGAIDGNESPLKAALREFKEEAWYTGKILKTYPLSTYKHENGFKYYTYLVFVPQEFKPHLNHETDDHRWVGYDEWPRPLHPKLKLTLNSFKVDSILQELSE